MNHVTTSVHVIQAQQPCFAICITSGMGTPFILMSLDQTERILPKNLEDHADMNTIRAVVSEVLEKGDDA
jgi:hypothetical protein